MNRRRADVPPSGPPRDLPHGRPASLRVQVVKTGKEITDRTWRRRLTPDCCHPRINLLKDHTIMSKFVTTCARRWTGPPCPHDAVSTKAYAKLSTAVKACVRCAISRARSVMLETRTSRGLTGPSPRPQETSSMVRMRPQGSPELDEVRETIGLRPAGPVEGWTAPGEAAPGASAPYSDVVRRGHRGRQLLGVVTVVSGGVALTHQVLAGAVAHGWGPLGAAATLLAWPAPLVQPILAGVGALVLCVVGIMPAGWRHIEPRQDWLLLAGAIAAVLGAAPMVLVCALIAVVCVLVVVVGLVILLFLLALLLR
jgi:hypothetical protein